MNPGQCLNQWPIFLHTWRWYLNQTRQPPTLLPQAFVASWTQIGERPVSWLRFVRLGNPARRLILPDFSCFHLRSPKSAPVRSKPCIPAWKPSSLSNLKLPVVPCKKHSWPLQCAVRGSRGCPEHCLKQGLAAVKAIAPTAVTNPQEGFKIPPVAGQGSWAERQCFGLAYLLLFFFNFLTRRPQKQIQRRKRQPGMEVALWQHPGAFSEIRAPAALGAVCPHSERQSLSSKSFQSKQTEEGLFSL